MAHLQRAVASICGHELAMSVGLGPHGLDQLYIDEANQPTITNCGDVILSSDAPGDALGALILKLVADSCASLGDASKRVLLMVLAGLREYQRTGLHPHTFQYDLASQVLQCTVPSAVLHVPLPREGPPPGSAAAEVLHALIATHLCGQAGGPSAEERLGDCLQELVLLQLRAAAAAGLSAAQALAALRDDPPLARLPGAPATESRLLQGVLLHEGPLAGPAPKGDVLLQSPLFLALGCPLEGEDIAFAGGARQRRRDGGGGCGVAEEGGGGDPAVAVRVGSTAERAAGEASAAELVRQRVALLAERGVGLVLLCGRPPSIATQLCHQYGICLVAGLDEQDVARACAAGGAAPPLSRSGPAALTAAPLGRAAAARLVALGPGRWGLLLEFSAEQRAASGQAACTLLLRGVSEVVVRQSARAVRRCLISVAAAVGTMSPAAAGGGDVAVDGASSVDDVGAVANTVGGGGVNTVHGGGVNTVGDGGVNTVDGGSVNTVGDVGGGGGGGGECLVFVAGGGGFEGLLEMQLRELSDVAKRGVPEDLGEADEGEKEREKEEQGLESQLAEQEADAEDARAASELLASLRVLHAMAAAVPRALTGAGGDGSGAVSAAQRRARREALLQVHALRRCQAEALRGQLRVARCGLVVPSAAFSFHGRALRGVADGCGDAVMAAVQGSDGGSGGGGKGCEYDSAFVRARAVLGGHDFVAVPDAVSYGVVEAAAVVTSAWSYAVDIVRQVIRIDGTPVAVVSLRGRRGGTRQGWGAGVAVAGPSQVAVPRRVRRGGRHAGWSDSASSSSSSEGASDGRDGD